jgi:hypothetical protein
MLGRVDIGTVLPRPRVLGVEFRECEEVLRVGAHHPGSLAGSGLSCAWRKRSSDQGGREPKKRGRNGILEKEERVSDCNPKGEHGRRLGVNQSGDLYRPPKTLEPWR